MKNGKLKLLSTPLGVVAAVGAVVLGAELLFMALLHEFLMVQFKLSDTAWNFVDAIALTAAITPLLYFLVFRSMHDSEERIRQINAAALNAIIVVNEQGNITDWNPAAEKMFQYSREEAVGQQMHQLLPPSRYRADAERGFASFEETGEGPVIGKVTEISALRKDGSEFPVELSISAAKLKGHWHAIGVIRDITERKEAEELAKAQQAEIERARQDWKAVFDSISQPIFLHDKEFRVIRANRAYAEQAGKPFKEIIGQPYYTLFPKSDTPLPCCLRAMEKAEEEEEEEEEVAIGEAIYRSRTFSVRNEQGVYLYSVHILEDITERKQAEQGMRESEERYRTMIENSNDLIWVIAPDRKFTFANQQAAEAIGYAVDDWIGKTFEPLVLEEDLPMVLEIHGKVMRGEKVHYEVRGKKADGGILVLSVNASPIFKGDKVVGTISFATDITERKRVETVLRESEQRFQHLFENMSSGVVVYQPDAACEVFTIKSVNKATERIDQVRREEVVGRNVEEVFPGVCAFGLLEVFKRVCRSGSPERFPAAFYRDERIAGWRENYVYRLDSGEIVAVYDDVSERKQAEQVRLESSIRLKDAMEDAIGAIAATLEQRDPYTAGHQRRVAELAAAIGEEMGLAREVIEGIHFGGLIHDLGKISVPAEILGKPGRLTDIELDLIKTHAEAGYEIVKEVAFPWPVADMVRQHHERLDGSGYPQGLKGDEIALEARILAVADVVEAMSANRPYRPGFGMDASLGEIIRNRGTQLDAVAVDACLRVIREKGFVFTK